MKCNQLKDPHCPIEACSRIENGKQYDLEIKIPEDNRDVMFGVLKDCYNNPIEDAVVKLIEIGYDSHEDIVRRPVSHTFTDKNGEFVFGPLCPNLDYALQIWVNRVEQVGLCYSGTIGGSCLQGEDVPCQECEYSCNTECEDKREE